MSVNIPSDELISRRLFIGSLFIAAGSLMTGRISARTMKGMVMQKPDCVNYGIELESIHSGFDGNKCWVHARAGAIPGAASGGMPIVVLTMQKLLLSASMDSASFWIGKDH